MRRQGHPVENQHPGRAKHLRQHPVTWQPVNHQSADQEPGAGQKSQGDPHRRRNPVFLKRILHEEDHPEEHRHAPQPREELHAHEFFQRKRFFRFCRRHDRCLRHGRRRLVPIVHQLAAHRTLRQRRRRDGLGKGNIRGLLFVEPFENCDRFFRHFSRGLHRRLIGRRFGATLYPPHFALQRFQLGGHLPHFFPGEFEVPLGVARLHQRGNRCDQHPQREQQ